MTEPGFRNSEIMEYTTESGFRNGQRTGDYLIVRFYAWLGRIRRSTGVEYMSCEQLLDCVKREIIKQQKGSSRQV